MQFYCKIIGLETFSTEQWTLRLCFISRQHLGFVFLQYPEQRCECMTRNSFSIFYGFDLSSHLVNNVHLVQLLKLAYSFMPELASREQKNQYILLRKWAQGFPVIFLRLRLAFLVEKISCVILYKQWMNDATIKTAVMFCCRFNTHLMWQLARNLRLKVQDIFCRSLILNFMCLRASSYVKWLCLFVVSKKKKNKLWSVLVSLKRFPRVNAEIWVDIINDSGSQLVVHVPRGGGSMQPAVGIRGKNSR